MELNNNTTPTMPQQPVSPQVPAGPIMSAPSESPTPAPTPMPTPTAGVVADPPKKSGMGKKPIIVLLMLLIILVALGTIGYYYYANMMNKPEPQAKAFPTLAPAVTAVPTEDPQAIKNDADLDNAVKELDSATDEADMTSQAKSLQTDSSF